MELLNKQFAIVILRHNGYDITIRALDSVYSVVYDKVLVILVDNASTDNCLTTIKQKYTNLIVVENENNLNYCAAYNVGIKKAIQLGADYINITHNDSYAFSDNYFRIIANTFSSNPKIGLIGTKSLDADRNIVWGGENHKKLGVDMNTPTCGYAISRKVFETIGLLDERLVVYFEDLDFILRLRDEGFITKYLGSINFIHQAWGTTIHRVSPKYHYYRVRNIYWFMKKHKKHMNTKLVLESIVRLHKIHFKSLFISLKNVEIKNSIVIAFSITMGIITGIIIPYKKRNNKMLLLNYHE
jgi:GT2 family glycosyltransferase